MSLFDFETSSHRDDPAPGFHTIAFGKRMANESMIELHAFTPREAGSSGDDVQPRRPKASPRSTPSPPSSGWSTPSPLEAYELGDAPTSATSGVESPRRGRSKPPVVGPIMRPRDLSPLATPKRRAGPSSVDSDDHRVISSHRLMSKDLTVSPAELDDLFVLEPYPTGTVNLNVAEILSEASSSGTPPSPGVDWSGFAGHRDTFALARMHSGGPARFLHPDLPPTFFQILERYIDFGTYLSIRLSCRCWSAAISSVRPPRFATIASTLPVEIVQRICALLSPIDFNAARHSCRAWMLASLSHPLLVQMLRQGGWWSAAQADITLIEDYAPRKTLNGEWLLSKRLSTECSLRPDWTGNGLADNIRDDSASYPHGSSLISSLGRPAFESFIFESEIDFSGLSPTVHDAEEGLHASGSRFTISVCGKYLLVTRDCTIYIYSLKSHASITQCAPSPRPVERLTSLVCPHRVLAVSMDTSCGRFAVAALLQGRVGFVCDLRELENASQRSAQVAYPWDTVFSALLEHQDSVANSTDLSSTYGRWFSTPATPGPLEALSRRTSSNYSDDPRTRPNFFVTQTNTTVAPGLSSVFYDLGSVVNPPLSVAICAQRQCIAFGCSSAVELHWVDALTGQSLNRRFSIPTGGEILHFSPKSKGERRMRVIGSEAVSDAAWRLAGKEGRLAPADEGEKSETESSTTGASDYYNVIPLSDGTHVLFASRQSAELCLGIETPPTMPAMDTAYMRWKTRAILEGPLMDGKSGRTAPRIYEAARDLRWGGRVVAGFGDEVWVFAVPSDVLNEKAGEFWSQHWAGGEDDDQTSVLRVGGIKVGEVEGLARVGICAHGGGLLVRAIGRAGLLKEWKLTRRAGNVKRWAVRSDGSVFARAEFDGEVERDADGDVVMRDYIRRENSSCYDEESAHHDDNDDDDESGGGIAIEFDLDCDVIMRDVGEYYGGTGRDELDEELDEGYFSDEQGGGEGMLAIHPAHTGYRGMGIEMGKEREEEEDLWESSRVEVEVLGGCRGSRG